LCLTGALACNHGQDRPLVLLYGLLIPASGLWLRPELVRFTTGTAIAGYLALVIHASAQEQLRTAPLHHMIAVFALLAAGEVVAYQVRRVRLLGRHFGEPGTQ
jgi:hypothetical protein